MALTLSGCGIDKNKNAPIYGAFDIQPVTSADEASKWDKLNQAPPSSNAQKNNGAQSKNEQSITDESKKGASADNKTTTQKDENKKEDETKARPEDQSTTNTQDKNAVREAEQNKLQSTVDDPNTPWYKKIGAKVNQGWNWIKNKGEDVADWGSQKAQNLHDWSQSTLNNEDSAWYKKAGAKVVSWIF